ncbi:hypothetical protein [Pectinatus frisingensis]|uniref:hypothetical protein n=1 Tax=Pectinatus frisingensis TaxID=865 RepID=UPI003D80494A
MQPKNPGIALALTIVFGGFGLLYSSVKYAIILLIVDVIAFIGSVLMPMIDRDFMSVSPLLMMIVILSWPASIILAWHSVKTYNKGLKRGKN